MEGLTTPFTLFDVTYIYRGDGEIADAKTAPVKIIRYGINHEVRATAPSVTFIDHQGRKGLASVDMFYTNREEAELEIIIATKGQIADFDPLGDWAQCGKLIDEYGIMFESIQHEDGKMIQAYLRGRGTSGPKGVGKNHRVAALRCLLASNYAEGVPMIAESDQL
ncbi:hypothetical protein OX89_14125 [Diaphorobacter sp. J5-51]|nr:hypothetical protein OX89_14125 [Diaphorobacter sp. J5-51]